LLSTSLASPTFELLWNFIQFSIRQKPFHVSFMSGDPYKPRGFLSDFERGVYQSVTSRSREFPFPGIIQFFYGFGTGIEKIWYRKKSWNRSRKKLVPKKVSEPVSAKLGTEKSLGIGLEKIWYRKKNIGTSLEIFRLFVLIWVTVSSRSRDFCTFLDGIGTGLEKIWYRKKSRNRSRKKWVPKKVSESVSKNFGTKKSFGIGLEKFGTEKKSRNRSRSDFGSRHTLLIMLYFWKAKGPRTSKMIFWTLKYTNTQIHKYIIWESAGNTQHVLYFREKKQGSKDIKNDILHCQIH